MKISEACAYTGAAIGFCGTAASSLALFSSCDRVEDSIKGFCTFCAAGSSVGLTFTATLLGAVAGKAAAKTVSASFEGFFGRDQ